MIASRVTFSKETRLKLQNPALDYAKRRKLKIERVKEYIREQPAGTKFRMEDLIAAAGYNEDQYASGYGFITALNRSGILQIEKTSKYYKEVTIPGDANKVKEPKQTIEEIRAEETKEEETIDEPADKVRDIVETPTFSRLEYVVVDTELIRQIENLAREFSWNNNSNDLREFIKSLK